MSTNSPRRIRLLATIVAWMVAAMAAAVPAFAVAPLVSATLEPSQIVLGQSAELTITSTGNGMAPVNLPEVSGLEFRVVGQSRRIEIINRATLETTSIVLRVTPQTAGIFTIPGITPKSQPLVLRVNPDNGTGNAPAAGGPNAPGKAPLVTSSSGIRMTADGSAFIRLILPKREIYVGESIPVEIEVGLRDGFARLNGLPALTGQDFTLNNLSRQPEHADRVIDGKPFTVFTWHSVLAGVKPGDFSLSVESPFTVRIRTRPARESNLDDMLGDPFLQNLFGATVQKDITVTSPASDLTVLALPTEGRPAGFSGAVGSFKIAGDLSSSSATAGDPLTLRMHVTGSGNFDRVDSPMLEHLDQWKTYPPRSTFKGSDTLGYKGEKTFEQPLIAAKPGTQTLPALNFSYFDPATRQYETAHSAPLTVNITPSNADASPSTPQAPSPVGAHSPATASAPPSAPEQPSNTGLRPDHPMAEAVASSLLPLYFRPRFLAIPSLLALLFAGGWLGLRQRGAGRTDSRSARRVSMAATRIVNELEAAARARNPALFFTRARIALTRVLATRWQLAPEQISAAELDARLGSEDDDIRQILALADEANYSGHELTSTDFERWTQIIRRRLEGEPA